MLRFLRSTSRLTLSASANLVGKTVIVLSRSKFGLYFRTLRHLRISQMIGQVRVRVAQRLMEPSVVKSRGWRLDDRKLLLDLSAPVPAQDAGALAAGRFEFIGHRADLGSSPDWLATGQSKLWKYNLHYFDWLWSLLDAGDDYWESAKDLMLDWIERHPPTKGACGWEPYPTSLRLINWCLLYGWRHQENLAKDPTFRDTLLDSIGRQVAWLERNLETHIQANHLLENFCALVCVASVFKGPDRIRLQKCYQPQLANEIHGQILPDGMHYERSPMYHLRVMWLLEMLNGVGDSSVQELLRDPLARAKVALVDMTHPDGEIAQLNDAAIGIYANTWWRQVSNGAWALPEAGYYGYRNGEGDYLVIDAGPIGPDYQPAHAHADLLSFELSLAGLRVITDTGVGTYEIGAQRFYDRSTAAHSTVEVDGKNSIEVWSGFRVGRRTEPRVLRWEPREDGCFLEAEHCGYHYLPSRAVHRRTFEWQTPQIEIRDHITICESVNIISRIHLAPEVEVHLVNNKAFCRVSELTFTIEVEGVGRLKIQQSNSFKYFGQSQRRKILVIETLATPPSLAWVWRLKK